MHSSQPACYPLEIDSLKIEVIVDNHCDALSSVPAAVASEFARLLDRPDPLLSGANICCAGHGLSLLLTARRGDESRQLLFDAGPDPKLFERNAAALGLDLSGVTDIVLSHGHWDHAGGLLNALRLIRDKQADPVNCHLNSGMFVRRGLAVSGRVLEFEPVPSSAEIGAAGARLVVSDDERCLGEGFFYLSGEIPRKTPFEEGFVGHLRWDEEGGDWVDDALIMDERYLAVRIKGRGMVTFSACSHAGSVNVLRDVKARFPDERLFALMGGLHLSGLTMERKITPTIDALHDLGLELLIPAHCTGWRATNEIARKFGENRMIFSSVGQQIKL